MNNKEFAVNAIAKSIGALACLSGLASAELVGPLPYLSVADSPFKPLGLLNFQLEDFEDGLANTPGLHFNGEVNAPLMTTDSVDGDDGAIDGFGRQGFSGSYGSFPEAFRFDTFPTHVGFVITDVRGPYPPQATAEVVIRVYDRDSNLAATYGRFPMGDGRVLGETAEDRFVGIILAGGISRIAMDRYPSLGLEIDHIQYGTIPAPGALAVLGVVASMGGRTRRGPR